MKSLFCSEISVLHRVLAVSASLPCATDAWSGYVNTERTLKEKALNKKKKQSSFLVKVAERLFCVGKQDLNLTSTTHESDDVAYIVDLPGHTSLRTR